MATTIQFRRGTTAQVDAVTPSSGEPVWETDGVQLAIGDGSTAGGLHVVMASGVKKVAITIPAAAITGEEHGLAVSYTGTLSSGDSMVAGNFATVPQGTGGSWVSGIYAKVTQGTTKAVNGYISGAEFEVIMTGSYNPSDWAPLVLNANNSTTGSQAKAAFILLRDYGSQNLDTFARFYDATKGTTDSTKIISSVSDGFEANCLVTVKMMYGTTPLWLLATETAPA